jgi:hypothetical protein
MKSKVNAFKERLQREPAFPNGSPERRDHHGSVEDEPPRRATSVQKEPMVIVAGDWEDALGHHGKHRRVDHLVSRTLRFGTRVSTQLQQAHGKRGQQTRASVSGCQHFAIAAARCDIRFSGIDDNLQWYNHK